MKYFLILLFVVLSILLPFPLLAQSANSRTDYNKLYKSVLDEYGFDQVLVNGIIYVDKYQPKAGHQYFPEDQPYIGTLIFRGIEYTGLEMEYDICDQQLIISVTDNYKTVRIVPSNDFISGFTIDNRIFSKYDFLGTPEFYQVVFDAGKLKCLFHWYKKVIETGNTSNASYYHFEFTDSKKRSYLYLDGVYENYKNNRSFIRLFPEGIRNNIKKYLRTNFIRVAKSSDEELKALMSYCNSIL